MSKQPPATLAGHTGDSMGLRFFGTYKGRNAVQKATEAAASLPHIPNLWITCGGTVTPVKGSNPYGVELPK